MASVLNSARTSTASLFDVVTNLSTTASQLVSTASSAVEALDLKAQNMVHRVRIESKTQRVVVTDSVVAQAASEHCDIMEEIHKRNFPEEAFDRGQFYIVALRKMQEATA